MTPTIIATDEVPHEIATAIEGGVMDFNFNQGPMGDAAQVFAYAQGQGGELVGGAMGRRWGDYCELQYLWVKDDHRGQGFGSQLLAAFERRGAEHGCRIFILDTFSFQAPSFYARHGYEVLHEMSGFPHGNSKFTMRKALGAA